MHRTQLQLDDAIYQEIRQRAFRSGRSVAREIRDLLQQALQLPQGDGEDERRWERALAAVGMFRDPTGEPVSSDHDDYLD